MVGSKTQQNVTCQYLSNFSLVLLQVPVAEGDGVVCAAGHSVRQPRRHRRPHQRPQQDDRAQVPHVQPVVRRPADGPVPAAARLHRRAQFGGVLHPRRQLAE